MALRRNIRPWKDNIELDADWQQNWTQHIGSPRFEAARCSAGVDLEELKPRKELYASLSSQTVGAVPDDVRCKLEERAEARRLKLARDVLLERERIIQGSSSSDAGVESSGQDWAQATKEKNEKEIKALRASLEMENDRQRKLLVQEFAKQFAEVVRAEQLSSAIHEAEQASEEREAQRQHDMDRRKKEQRQQRALLEQQRLQREEEEAADRERRRQQLRERDAARERAREQAEAKRKAAYDEREQRWLKRREKSVATIQQTQERLYKMRLGELSSKDSRLQDWRGREVERQEMLRVQTRQQEQQVSRRIRDAMVQQHEEMRQMRSDALARNEAAERRVEHCRVQQGQAVEAKRASNEQRFQRQSHLFQNKCIEEEHRKESIRKRLEEQERSVERQRAVIESQQMGKRILSAAMNDEKEKAVERMRRSYEHSLMERTHKISQMEDRCAWLARERQTLLAERQRTAQSLALQRTRMQQSLGGREANVSAFARSPSMLASLGLDEIKVKELTSSLLSSRSTPRLASSAASSSAASPLRSPSHASAFSLRSQAATSPLRPQTARPGKLARIPGARPSTASSDPFGSRDTRPGVHGGKTPLCSSKLPIEERAPQSEASESDRTQLASSSDGTASSRDERHETAAAGDAAQHGAQAAAKGTDDPATTVVGGTLDEEGIDPSPVSAGAIGSDKLAEVSSQEHGPVRGTEAQSSGEASVEAGTSAFLTQDEGHLGNVQLPDMM